MKRACALNTGEKAAATRSTLSMARRIAMYSSPPATATTVISIDSSHAVYTACRSRDQRIVCGCGWGQAAKLVGGSAVPIGVPASGSGGLQSAPARNAHLLQPAPAPARTAHTCQGFTAWVLHILHAAAACIAMKAMAAGLSYSASWRCLQRQERQQQHGGMQQQENWY